MKLQGGAPKPFLDQAKRSSASKPLNAVNGEQRAERASAPAPAQTSRGIEGLLQLVRDSGDEPDAAREAHLARIQRDIEAGTYSVSSKDIARALIDETIRMHGGEA